MAFVTAAKMCVLMRIFLMVICGTYIYLYVYHIPYKPVLPSRRELSARGKRRRGKDIYLP